VGDRRAPPVAALRTQAHFTREFRALAGITPGELFAHRIPGGGWVSVG